MAEAPSPHESILIVEDDPEIAELIEVHLQDLGYGVTRADNGKDGLREARHGGYDLLILDIMLPDLDGFEICKRVRTEDRSIPILMLTAKTEEVDKVLGLELGADDYITKPFSIRELTARVKANLRRVEVDREELARSSQEKPLQYNNLVIEPEKRRVKRSGEPLDLTAKEFDLLLLLARHPGKAFDRQELLEQVWGYQHTGYSHTVNTHINRLRNKIEDDPSEPRFVQTVWGVGYRFAEPEELSS